ncbi:MAG: hypothetical protein CMG75_04350 [Candidatus Marinimicrobia bacterium]|nr:hypothetical protein [Candidatus Neomarinimicrobiota bacterium]|tara:strand:+ start:47716 stop:48288 length:573 start_codon:yes stop_codon:yes gene_type:complete
MTTFGINKFVRRQVKGSGKTYSYNLSFEEILAHVTTQYNAGHFQTGYRDGVIIVAGSETIAKNFACPFVEINQNTRLRAEWVKRQSGEEEYIRIRALNGKPLPAGKVEFILYNHATLKENQEQTSNADWELISMHALPEGIESLPIGPVTMMRNQLELKGGTKGSYSTEEWAQSVRFWQRYAAVSPEIDT